MIDVHRAETEHELALVDESFVVRPAVIAHTIEQPLIPPAARLDIADGILTVVVASVAHAV